ncbi:MAG: metallophosphoesterase [Actinobacteria bacterium]|nr:metallophosphoesterase [Actinomycetota bacterium]
MAVKLIADPHGRFDDLPERVSPGDVLIVLGDVLDLIDWADISGILPEVVGKDALVGKLLAAMAAGPQAAVELRDELLRPEGDYYERLEERVRSSYERFAAVLGRMECTVYVIYGNGDIPVALAECLDGMGNAVLAPPRVEIGGRSFGFVHGALYSPFMMPAEMDDEAYGSRLRELGPVDVLCTHIPPRLEEAVFDVVAGRPVEGSASLLAYVEENQPGFLYHGHVHQPAQRELRVGRTRVINAGYYKRQGYVHLHED